MIPTSHVIPLGTMKPVAVLNQFSDHPESSPTRRSPVTATLITAGTRMSLKVLTPADPEFSDTATSVDAPNTSRTDHGSFRGDTIRSGNCGQCIGPLGGGLPKVATGGGL